MYFYNNSSSRLYSIMDLSRLVVLLPQPLQEQGTPAGASAVKMKDFPSSCSNTLVILYSNTMIWFYIIIIIIIILISIVIANKSNWKIGMLNLRNGPLESDRIILDLYRYLPQPAVPKLPLLWVQVTMSLLKDLIVEEKAQQLQEQ